MQAHTLTLKGFLKALGMAIAITRIKAGIKQKDLAGKIGISSSYLCQIEGGKRNINMKILAKIAVRLDMELLELLQLAIDMLNEGR